MGKRTERRTLNHLPEEILEQIFYNLPAKSLLRFKCVSKSWRSLITRKSFIKEHFKKSNRDIDNIHHKLMSSFRQSPNVVGVTPLLRGPNRTLRSRYFRSLLHNNTPTGNYNNYMIVILGSCNGLVLISVNHRKLFLWNPCTRKIKNITNMTCLEKEIYGLGYDEYTDDYKVVSSISVSNGSRKQTQIYSSKTDSWKKIEHFDECYRWSSSYDSGKLVNGRLHWLMSKDGYHFDIISLDLVEEKYEVVGGPENFTIDIWFKPILKILGGYLSLISASSTMEAHINAWVMIKYGERESWTKIWTFSFSDGAMKPTPMKLLTRRLVITKKNKSCKSRVDVFDATMGSYFYVESLVSPFGDR